MVEATLKNQLDVFLPGVDIVDLEASDGETWASRRLGSITGAVVCLNTDSDAYANVTFSGQTATLNLAGLTDARVTLILFGS
ncbi:hypothetical protein HY571_01825 [Candidatus Micrarchaeota archaeon]|nr:hypothetical protein [Candidatus Micrarchaeota archaeon]